eukprot:651955-Hanusia_phi.AAC.1
MARITSVWAVIAQPGRPWRTVLTWHRGTVPGGTAYRTAYPVRWECPARPDGHCGSHTVTR